MAACTWSSVRLCSAMDMQGREFSLCVDI
jgi:hypothetical protein